MFSGLNNMMAQLGTPGSGGQQQGGQPQQQQQQQGGFFGGFGGQQQQHPQGQQQPPQQQQGGGGGLFGGLMSGFGGGSSGLKSLETATPLLPPQQPLEVQPVASVCFKANTKFVTNIFPMEMEATLYYDFPGMRMKQEWNGGWEIERWDLLHKVRKQSMDDAPEVTALDKDGQLTSFGVPPDSTFLGWQVINGIQCMKFEWKLGAIFDVKVWISSPTGPEDKTPQVPIFADYSALGIRTWILFQNHDLNFYMDPSIFAIEQYIPPPVPIIKVSGYIKSALNNRGIAGGTVTFGEGLSATANENGLFSLELPAVLYNEVKYSANGYSCLVKGLNVQGPIPAGTIADACLSPQLAEGQTRFVLRWFAAPRDLDIRAVGDDNNACYYANRVTNRASLNVDVQCGYGPETMTITNIEPTTTILINNYSGERPIAGCGAVVDAYNHTGHVAKFEAPATGNGRNWMVCTVQGSNIVPIGEIQ